MDAVTVCRFAPSPSGVMHLGNVFSALLAWLSVRSAGGRMLLRIEDLDPDRSKPVFADAIRRDLEWLGLDWDRESEPQSKRTEYYRAAFEALEAQGLVYPCYCTRAQLHAASAPHAWRLKVPDETISFRDGLQGEYRENLLRDCGDFIIRRSDGVYAYQLAVVVDDAGMGVSQVVRGCDLLSSTPRQLYLYRLLDKPAPAFYHVPLLTAPDGRRLSKRDGDLDLSALRLRYAPEALIGLLACAAGLLPKPERVSARELVPQFRWEDITHEKTISIRSYLQQT